MEDVPAFAVAIDFFVVRAIGEPFHRAGGANAAANGIALLEDDMIGEVGGIGQSGSDGGQKHDQTKVRSVEPH